MKQPVVWNELTHSSQQPTYVYQYDQYGNLRRQYDGNVGSTVPTNGTEAQYEAISHTHFTYDAQGRRTGRILPDGAAETWEYTEFGQVWKHKDFKDQWTQYLYDTESGSWYEEQRFEGMVDGTPDERTFYWYDVLGRLENLYEYADGVDQGYMCCSYDPVTGGVDYLESPEGMVSHAYDAVTGQVTLTFLEANETWYAYDDLGRLQTVCAEQVAWGWTTQYAYDAAGNLASELLPNGVRTTYAYDALGRLARLTVTKANGNKLFEQDYALLPNGQRDYVVEKRYDGVSSTPTSVVKIDWEYDALNRLTEEVRDVDPTPGNGINNFGTSEAADYKHAYAFDLVGNRMLKTVDEGNNGSIDERTAYAYNGRDQLMAEGPDVSPADGTPDTATATSYTYDANGNTTSVSTGGTTLEYDWDLRGRMIGYDADGDGVADPGDATYAYDHEGNRVSKTVIDLTGTPATTTYLIDPHNPSGCAKAPWSRRRFHGGQDRGSAWPRPAASQWIHPEQPQEPRDRRRSIPEPTQTRQLGFARKGIIHVRPVSSSISWDR